MKTPDEIKRTPRLLILREGPDGGWDHVSVSFRNRTPTWDEMCEIKRMFFRPDEICVEYHPAESEYVNNMPYCLHIWRPQREPIPTPPSWMVGSKQGQTLARAIKQGVDELTATDAGQLASDPGAAAQEQRERQMEYGA